MAEWQGRLRATARGWNGYQNKSQHTKLALEKKILLPLLSWLKPVTIQSQVWCSNHWAIPTPHLMYNETHSNLQDMS